MAETDSLFPLIIKHLKSAICLNIIIVEFTIQMMIKEIYS